MKKNRHRGPSLDSFLVEEGLHEELKAIVAKEAIAWQLDHMEDEQFLRAGRGEYPEEKNRADFFNFGGPRNSIDSMDPMYAGHLTLPRWRMMLKVQPIPHVYIMGGFDDILNAVDYGPALDPNNPQLVLRNPRFHGYGTDFMIGVGITFRDDDLRTILPFLPSL